MSSPTTNFGWLKPTVGGDNDVWGDYLDTNLDNQDGLVRRFMNTFINSTAPTEAQAGTQWLDNTTNPWMLNIYDGSDWILMGTINTTTNSFVSASSASLGDMKFSAQTTNHGGWLICNGASVSTTTYSGLFALIGYNFGGSGATFTLPDMRGRVPGAIGTGSGLSTRTQGQSLGEENHVLTVGELAAHTHSLRDLTSGIIVDQSVGASLNGATGLPYANGSVSQTPAFEAASTGSSTGHNTMQPTLFVGNYFIYSGV